MLKLTYRKEGNNMKTKKRKSFRFGYAEIRKIRNKITGLKTIFSFPDSTSGTTVDGKYYQIKGKL